MPSAMGGLRALICCGYAKGIAAHLGLPSRHRIFHKRGNLHSKAEFGRHRCGILDVLMLLYLGRLLARTRNAPVHVRYLSKAEATPAWQDGVLLSIDPQGACFGPLDGEQIMAECLPWGSIGSIRVIEAYSTIAIDVAASEKMEPAAEDN